MTTPTYSNELREKLIDLKANKQSLKFISKEDWWELFADEVTLNLLEVEKLISEATKAAEAKGRLHQAQSLRIHVEALSELGYNQMTEVLHQIDKDISDLQSQLPEGGAE